MNTNIHTHTFSPLYAFLTSRKVESSPSKKLLCSIILVFQTFIEFIGDITQKFFVECTRICVIAHNYYNIVMCALLAFVSLHYYLVL